jgi:hypothetical protein
MLSFRQNDISAVIFWMWASYGGEEKGYSPVGCNAVRFLVKVTSRNNISPHFQGRRMSQTRELGIILDSSELQILIIQRVSVFKLIFSVFFFYS